MTTKQPAFDKQSGGTLVSYANIPFSSRTLTTTVVDLSSSLERDDTVLVKLKEASLCIAELLTNHASDMCSLGEQVPIQHSIFC